MDFPPGGDISPYPPLGYVTDHNIAGGEIPKRLNHVVK